MSTNGVSVGRTGDGLLLCSFEIVSGAETILVGFDFLNKLTEVAEHLAAEHFRMFPETLEQFDLLELSHPIDLRLGGAVDEPVRVLEEPLEQVADLLVLPHVEHVLIAHPVNDFLFFRSCHGGNPFVI